MTLTVNFTSTIDTDQFDAGADAVRYGADNITVTVGAGVSFISYGDDGVFSSRNGSALINNGNIFGHDNGVQFDGDNATIVNNADRSITGNRGILVNGDTTVTNHGIVSGLTKEGVLFGAPSDDNVLNNDGVIYGQDIGVFLFSSADGGVVNNSGLIHSDVFGVFVGSSPGLLTVINNAAGGTIKGTDAAIGSWALGDGRIFLNNHGTIAGDIDLDGNTGNVNDTVINKGKITGDVLLGLGTDIFNGLGGTATKVFGENGNDTLTGGNGRDQLDGGEGNDVLRGALGRDILTGGPDRDFFDFNTIGEAAKGTVRDIVTDFNRTVDDRIDLSGIDAKTSVGGNQAFKFIGTQAFHDVKGELRCKSGIVQADVNGDGKADFEIKVNLATMVAGDFLL